MINTSTEYKKQVLKDGNQWKVLSEVTYSDGTNATLTNADLMENGLSFTDATSQKNKFCVGSFVSKMITLKVCNFENKFNPEKFESAKIHLQLKLFLDETQSWETLDFGTFYVDKHPCSGGIITLTAYNNAVKFEKKYDSTLTYPATLAEILQDACTNCGVILYSVTFPNSTYKVTNRPADDATTYADIVSYVAQLAGCFAKFNADGALVLDWYDTDRFYQDTGDILSGGDFSDYSQEDIISGGDFTDYDQPDTVFGGVFRQDLPAPAQISSLTNYEVASKDICITGVQIVPADSNKPIVKRGREGYVVSIEKNPLAQDNLDSLIDFLAKRLIGFTFRPMSATGWDDPSFEAGDVAVLTDPYGNKYQTIISNLQYEFGNYESFSADAETESENRSVNFDSGAKAVQEAKEETKRQISRYDQAVGSFASMAALAMGLYSTKEQLDDDSYILYWHDKPKLADSQTIWKLTQNVFTVSDDGGKTWRGMDKNGNILAKVLNVIGINADWINTGKISSVSNPNVYFDLIKGIIAASRLVSSDEGATDAYADIGLQEWANTGPTKGMRLFTKDGAFGSITQRDSLSSTVAPHQTLQINTPGDLNIAANTSIAWSEGKNWSCNQLFFGREDDGNGIFRIIRASGKGTIAYVASANSNGTGIYGTPKVFLETVSKKSWINVEDNGIAFGANGEYRGSIDATGFHGWINGHEGIDADITDKNGNVWHFRGGILTGVN